MDNLSLDLLRSLESRAVGLARKNWGHVAADNTWQRGTDTRTATDRINDEAEFNHVCSIIGRYVSYSEGDAASYYLLTTRETFGAG